MVMTVTLNPCIDWQLTIPSFTRGGMNRVSRMRRDIAGKGINVSIALRNLGLDTLCLGFNYHENGGLIEDKLDELGVRHDFIKTEGAVRTNIKLYEEDTGTMTEINQPGAYVPSAVIDSLIKKISGTRADMLVISGSRPAGADADIYHRIRSVFTGPVFLDAEGEALCDCLRPPLPFCIKPNLFELESSFGVNLPALKDISDFCKSLTGKGLPMVCVSMGKDGALLVTEKGAYFAPRLEIEARGVQGAGDAMVAGLVYGIQTGANPEELLRCAVAAASASVIRDGTEMCTREGFEGMLKKTVVTAI